MHINIESRPIQSNPDLTSLPSSPPKQARLKTSSRPPTPVPSTSPRGLHPTQPIQTPQQFYDWLDVIDRAGAHSQEAHFRHHVANVAEYLDACDEIIAKINEVDSDVEGMTDSWRIVEEGGRSLKDACERLLQERV